VIIDIRKETTMDEDKKIRTKRELKLETSAASRKIKSYVQQQLTYLRVAIDDVVAIERQTIIDDAIRDYRNKLMTHLFCKEEWTYSKIGRMFGLSHDRVRIIVGRMVLVRPKDDEPA